MDEPEFYYIATASQRRSQGRQGVSLRHGRSATGVDRRIESLPEVADPPAVRRVAQIGGLPVRAYRVFYDVDEAAAVVKVRAIRHQPPHKTTEERREEPGDGEHVSDST